LVADLDEEIVGHKVFSDADIEGAKQDLARRGVANPLLDAAAADLAIDDHVEKTIAGKRRLHPLEQTGLLEKPTHRAPTVKAGVAAVEGLVAAAESNLVERGHRRGKENPKV